ncbi:MAG: type II toxin-antitoxin system mRNA interferase toxin, RelE/StbE family [candidate division KSB1 bacterium]
MKLQWSEEFKKDYRALPQHIQKQTDRKLRLLVEDLFHPSLRAKKMKGRKDEMYEASITMNYRVLFQISGDTYLLRRIGTHDILNRN